jgi:predicted MPP superfamily phosphohydrolase
MTRIRTAALHGVTASTRFILFSALWLSLFAYAGRPLLVAAHAEGVGPATAWVLLFGLSLLPLLPLLGRRADSHLHGSTMQWIGYATMAVFSLLLTLVIAGDLVRFLYVTVRWIAAMPSWPSLDGGMINFTILGLTGLFSFVGLMQARCPRVRRVAIPIDDLPDALVGYRILQWSDVHVGPTIRRRFVASLVERTNAIAADAIVVTGDLVDGYVHDLREQIEPLADLRARDGVYYVTGNHEYYWRADEWVREARRLGLTFLRNEHRIIDRGGAAIVMAGITDPAGRNEHRPDPERALAGAPPDAVKVLLAHRPQAASEACRLGVDLQLSGHTHGGQFFPFNIFIRFFQPIVAGLHRVGSTWLYVSRGTGYWGPPSRLGVHGEITLIELTRA